jgi:hypothetical protein
LNQGVGSTSVRYRTLHFVPANVLAQQGTPWLACRAVDITAGRIRLTKASIEQFRSRFGRAGVDIRMIDTEEKFWRAVHRSEYIWAADLLVKGHSKLEEILAPLKEILPYSQDWILALPAASVLLYCCLRHHVAGPSSRNVERLSRAGKRWGMRLSEPANIAGHRRFPKP